MKHYDPEIRLLASLYDSLASIVDGFPDKDFETYTKKQKQYLMNELTFFSEQNSEILSSEISELIYPYPNLSFDKLCEILKSAHKKYTDSFSMRQNEWISFAYCFDEFTKNAIISSLDTHMLFDLILTKHPKTGKLILFNESSNSYRQAIYLVNPVFSDNLNTDCINVHDAEVEILNNGYRISCVQGDEIVTIDFDTISLEIILIDYSHQNTWGGSPWNQIKDCFNAILNKNSSLGLSFLNEKEKKLLPLCDFEPIHHFESPNQTFSSNKVADNIFIEFAIQAGNKHIAELTRAYSRIESSEDNPYRTVNFKEKKKACDALHKEMIKPSSEALARLILHEIKEAASQYPADVDLDISPEKLANVRKTITDIFKQHDYEGEYPHFKKMSAFKGNKFLEIQGSPEFIRNEKNMACMIDCYEYNIICSDNEELSTNFNVSTVFLKDDGLNLYDSLDGHSGFFIDKNRRRARNVIPNIDYRDDYISTYSLEECVSVAIKVAECKKITKEERSKFLTTSPGNYGYTFFVVFFLFTGLGFSLLLCPAMFLLGLIIGTPFTVLSSESPSFPDFFKSLLFDFPWWKMFLFCFLGYVGLTGLMMTIYNAFSKKKS